MQRESPLGRAWLIERGFRGFVSIAELRAASLRPVPKQPGVYAVLREAEGQPAFMAHNPGGRFKGKDPTLPVDVLRDRWNPNCRVVYLGKAGTRRRIATLRSRLRAYLEFGAGKSVGHWGGRLTWQLPMANQLVVAWATTDPDAARTLEKTLISEVEAAAGSLPLANLRR